MGAKPVSRKIAYDDLYRVNRVDYEYAGGTDPWTDPYAPETNGTATDTHLAKPSPHVKFDSRVLYESFHYDWLGNTTSTDDDAKGFYDRSLGAVTNGAGQSQPYQLKSASNESASGGGLRTGHLSTLYDKAGNLTDLAVVRKGPCLSVDGGSCTQRFHYDWDEAGRLVRARRWDVGGAPMATDRLPTTTTAAADLTYAYDAGDMRVRKAATDAAGVTAYTLYPSAALEERRCSWSESAQDYTNDASHEVPQLIAHGVRLGRVSYEAAAPGVPAAGSELPPGQHVFLSLSDHLGSTSTVIDLATSEVVEKRTSRAYGGVESDQRDARWGGAKDEKAFTGKEEDEEVGLTYFGARYLSSQLGRWVSADPLSVQSAGADLNVYAYVHGSVLRAVDPVGLATTEYDEQGRVSTVIYAAGEEPTSESGEKIDAEMHVYAPAGSSESGASSPIASETSKNWFDLALGIGFGSQQALTPGGDFTPSPKPDSRDFTIGQAFGQISTGIAKIFGGATLAAGGGAVAGAGVVAEGPSLGTSTVAVVGGSAMVTTGSALALSGAADIGRGAANLVHAPESPPPPPLRKVAPHGSMPSPRPQHESHHGIMSRWMKEHLGAKYDPEKAPAILLTKAEHNQTRAVFNRWHQEQKAAQGGSFSWGSVSSQQVFDLSEKMFDAAGVTNAERSEYYRMLLDYLHSL